MAGSLIFVIYLNQAGDNVTISPRIATYVSALGSWFGTKSLTEATGDT